jgi:hypothetical protein
MQEIWKCIRGYKGKYMISNKGRIRSFAQYKSGRMLTIRKGNKGYALCTLSKNGAQKTFSAHRIIARAFIGPAKGRQVNHIDGVKLNNLTPNLEYVTGRGNKRHAVKLGLIPRGEDLPQSKLRNRDIKNIRRLYETGKFSQQTLAKKFKVYQTVISRVVCRKIWAHV